MSAERPTLLFAGITPYTSLRQRPHWLAQGLTQYARVLYLDPHSSLLRGMHAESLTRIDDHLAVLTPAPVLPVTGYLRPLNRWSYRLTDGAVRRALAELGWAPPDRALVSFPKQIDLVRRCELERVVYDVMDDYPRFFDPLQARSLREMHAELIRRADVVTASSQVLADRARDLGAHDVRLVENAVSAEFVAACRAAAPAPELASLPRPLFGYIGVLAPWIDLEAIASLARAFPNGSVALVGPAERRLPSLPENVHVFGRRPHEALPAILKAFDVGLVPFRRDPLIDAVNPVKVYEYWAAGLRVLSTHFTEAERLKPHLVTADAAEWPMRARALLDEPAPAERPLPTWEDRVARLAEVLGLG